MDDRRTKAKVVDLLRYRQNRRQRTLDFSDQPAMRPVLAPVTPFRTLTPREVAHRQRMVAFLGRA